MQIKQNSDELQVNSSQPEQLIGVKVRKTRVDEQLACTTMLPGYPWVTVEPAEGKEMQLG